MEPDAPNGFEFSTLADAHAYDEATLGNGEAVVTAINAARAKFEIETAEGDLRRSIAAMAALGRFWGLADEDPAIAPLIGMLDGRTSSNVPKISHKDVIRLCAVDIIMKRNGAAQITGEVLSKAGPLAEALSHQIHRSDSSFPTISGGSPESMLKWWGRFQSKLQKHRFTDLIDIESGEIRHSNIPTILAPAMHPRARKGRPRD